MQILRGGKRDTGTRVDCKRRAARSHDLPSILISEKRLLRPVYLVDLASVSARNAVNTRRRVKETRELNTCNLRTIMIHKCGQRTPVFTLLARTFQPSTRRARAHEPIQHIRCKVRMLRSCCPSGSRQRRLNRHVRGRQQHCSCWRGDVVVQSADLGPGLRRMDR